MFRTLHGKRLQGAVHARRRVCIRILALQMLGNKADAVPCDKIDVSPRIAFFYTDLIDQDIAARKTDELPAFARVIVGNYRQFVCTYKIHFPGLMSFMFENPGDAQKFADDLLFVMQVQKEKYDERLALFETKAAQYHEQKIKPPVSEKQRRFIVQANALSQQKKILPGHRYLRQSH